MVVFLVCTMLAALATETPTPKREPEAWPECLEVCRQKYGGYEAYRANVRMSMPSGPATALPSWSFELLMTRGGLFRARLSGMVGVVAPFEVTYFEDNYWIKLGRWLPPVSFPRDAFPVMIEGREMTKMGLGILLVLLDMFQDPERFSRQQVVEWRALQTEKTIGGTKRPVVLLEMNTKESGLLRLWLGRDDLLPLLVERVRPGKNGAVIARLEFRDLQIRRSDQ
jgi:hypothetical protein